MANYGQHFSTLTTPQTEQARSDQKRNNAGGFTFTLDKWARLDRWLILGADGGTYYAGERKLTCDNAKVVLECLAEDGGRTVARIVEISDAGRAPKNDPAIFALAMAAADGKPETRAVALAALPKVCRIGTHLFHFVRDVENFRKWGRGLRTAVGKWYTEKKPDALAQQLLKYQQRDGWAHRDVLRLAHPKAPTPQHDAAFRWCVGAAMGERTVKRLAGKEERAANYSVHAEALPLLLAAYDELKASPDPKTTAKLIRQHRFTHEMVPTEHKNSVAVWEALLEEMPQTALVRNLAKMTAVGLFKPMGEHVKKAAAMIADAERLKGGARSPGLALVGVEGLRARAWREGEANVVAGTRDRRCTRRSLLHGVRRHRADGQEHNALPGRVWIDVVRQHRWLPRAHASRGERCDGDGHRQSRKDLVRAWLQPRTHQARHLAAAAARRCRAKDLRYSFRCHRLLATDAARCWQ